MHQPHDKLFKAGFIDPETTAGFLCGQLSQAVVEAIDWSSIQSIQQAESRLTAMSLAEKLRQEGRQEGRQEAVLANLEIRFGPVPVGLIEAVHAVADATHLDRLQRASLTCASFEEFAAAL